MMSLQVIQSENRKAARKAARNAIEPVVCTGALLDDAYHGASLPFPFIGDKRYRKWELIDTLFCDSSGFGGECEPALTKAQLLKRLIEGNAYAIIEIGQFQVYVGEFKRKGRS